MKRIIITLISITLLTGCSFANFRQEQMEDIRITAMEAYRKMQEASEVVVLDVRTPQEFADIRIDGALLIPDYDLVTQVKEEIQDMDVLILIYCRTGRRSAISARELIEMGFTNVYDFGGIVDWPFETVRD